MSLDGGEGIGWEGGLHIISFSNPCRSVEWVGVCLPYRKQLSFPTPILFSPLPPNICLPVLVCGSIYSTFAQYLENQTEVEV